MRVPSRADCAAAAALVPSRPLPARGTFGWANLKTRVSPRAFTTERWFLDVSPGTVRVRKKVLAPKFRFDDTDGVTEDRPKRGRIDGWSDSSRARMIGTLGELDYEPMFAATEGARAAMVTLTLPGGDWEALVPDPRAMAKLRTAFAEAYRGAWDDSLRAVWKLEFQRRGAPHLHLLMVPPRGRSRGRGITKGLAFEQWLSLRWTQIVMRETAAFKPTKSTQAWDHFLAGTGVDYIEGQRFSDPRRISVYFSKHGSFMAKDYQNELPAHWAEAIRSGEAQGARFWGYIGLKKAVETVEIGFTERPAVRRGPAARPAAWMHEDTGPARFRHQQPPMVDREGVITGDYVSSTDRAVAWPP